MKKCLFVDQTTDDRFAARAATGVEAARVRQAASPE
jgi:hypothetical protein